MPTGRGDGDEGSAPNLHIGYLDFEDDSGKLAIKPYIRSQKDNERQVPENGHINKYSVHRYWLIRMCKDDNKYFEANEGDSEKVERNKPYIKIAEISDKEGDPDSDVKNSKDLKKLEPKSKSNN